MDAEGGSQTANNIDISPMISRTTTPASDVPNSSHSSPSSIPDVPNDPITNMSETIVATTKKASTSSGTTGKLTSWVWEHYTKKIINNTEKAICKHCNDHLAGSSNSGTKHLMRHYSRFHDTKTKDIRQQVLQVNLDKAQFGLSPFSFDQDKTRMELTKMIVMHEYPLSMVQHYGFKRFCNSMNPCFKVVSRNTVKKDCFRIYDLEKTLVMDLLSKNESRVALTTDMWTSSSQKKGFMAVTTHFIDNSWKLQSRIISFIYVPSPHTSEVLCEALIHCLLDWNIDRKLSTVTVDNCSTNDAMMRLMLDKLPEDSLLLRGAFFHMRCCAHILNLIVKEGLDVIGDAIENVRDSVAFWSGTPKRCEKFEETARQLGITFGKKLILDCKTRWNSTFLMLVTALEYKNVFSRLKQREPNYKCLPSELDWSRTKEICDRLKIFYNATELFSGTKYPTANLYFPQICEIRVELKQWISCGIEFIEKMAEKMFHKFENYWSVVNGIMAVAAVFDPRFKTVLLEYYFSKIDIDYAEYEVEKILSLCRDLYEQYEDIERLKTQGDKSDSRGADVVTGGIVSLSDFDAFAARKKRKHPARTELDNYLEENILPRDSDFDVLGWWKNNKGKYPILCKVARDVLAIPVSTVASESAFSTSGRLISPHRSRLHPTTIEILMCLQNWLLNNSKDHESAGATHATILDDYDDENRELTEME